MGPSMIPSVMPYAWSMMTWQIQNEAMNATTHISMVIGNGNLRWRVLSVMYAVAMKGNTIVTTILMNKDSSMCLYCAEHPA